MHCVGDAVIFPNSCCNKLVLFLSRGLKAKAFTLPFERLPSAGLSFCYQQHLHLLQLALATGQHLNDHRLQQAIMEYFLFCSGHRCELPYKKIKKPDQNTECVFYHLKKKTHKIELKDWLLLLALERWWKLEGQHF